MSDEQKKKEGQKEAYKKLHESFKTKSMYNQLHKRDDSYLEAHKRELRRLGLK